MEIMTPTELRKLAEARKNECGRMVYDAMVAAADAWQLLIDAVNNDTGECLPECSSFGHADGCQYVDMAGTLVRLQQKLVTSERERQKLGVHLSHCNFGENAGVCKYGDTDCPSLTENWSWFGRRLEEARSSIREGNGPACNPYEGMTVGEKEEYLSKQEKGIYD